MQNGNPRRCPTSNRHCSRDREQAIQQRLEYLRGELRAERISYDETYELQGLAGHIEEGDVELLEAAGVPEFPEDADDESNE